MQWLMCLLLASLAKELNAKIGVEISFLHVYIHLQLRLALQILLAFWTSPHVGGGKDSQTQLYFSKRAVAT